MFQREIASVVKFSLFLSISAIAETAKFSEIGLTISSEMLFSADDENAEFSEN
ncbi:hypothetical protein [Paraburkholderia oxyphila]|uniref:hypothetical protein n=1 Tax=Paraburkholderia oxyphila TaxID=614212 RepID=UPI000AC8911D|nr:hypothetical protein [Paraburkholderia oxyphila]